MFVKLEIINISRIFVAGFWKFCEKKKVEGNAGAEM